MNRKLASLTLFAIAAPLSAMHLATDTLSEVRLAPLSDEQPLSAVRLAPDVRLAPAQRSTHRPTISVETSMTGASGSAAPLWLTANRDGLSSIANTSAYLRAGVARPIGAVGTKNSAQRNWSYGYAADVALAYPNGSTPSNGCPSRLFVHQLYGEAQYRKVRLTVGSKVQPLEFKNDALSTGGMTFSRNARPIPQVRAELADWWNITGRAHFLEIKGHIAYGMLTDGNWQERFVGGEESGHPFAKNILYHSKAGYFKWGDTRRFPLTAMFGLEMVAEFGGEVWNLGDRQGSGNEDFQSHQTMGHGPRDFFDAFLPGGSDVNDGAFANVAGNQLGSWTFSLDWNTPSWGLRAYMDHFFEDHSMMFFQYGWRDNLIGIEARLPRNRFVTTALYEHLNTTDQSGAIYHDATSVLPIQISGKDTYYNHHIYSSYQHWGQLLGNPLLVSPAYNSLIDLNTATAHPQQRPAASDPEGNPSLNIYHNRTRANHFALSGDPLPSLSWRLLMTHQHTLGTYDINVEDTHAFHLLAEATYTPPTLQNWHFSMAFASTSGTLFPTSQGMTATVAANF